MGTVDWADAATSSHHDGQAVVLSIDGAAVANQRLGRLLGRDSIRQDGAVAERAVLVPAAEPVVEAALVEDVVAVEGVVSVVNGNRESFCNSPIGRSTSSYTELVGQLWRRFDAFI